MNSVPRVLAVLDELLTAAAHDDRGALWQLAEQGRELDANLVRLPAGAEVGEHQEDVLDVLLVVVAGSGRIVAGGGDVLNLTPTTVVWLPRTSRRALVAGPEGLAYVTVHRRRPGLTIKPSTAYEGGEAPCMLDRVCPECGRLSQDPEPVFCSRCGERFPDC
ncbi:hypothetical protein ACFU8Q_07660 [Streptomyces sp. NPDC057543]|uniref:hypothetical protein n=1 Tax=Streptomyces sp. NPDC057543 TaxID=3346163 RepID=UPI0036965103